MTRLLCGVGARQNGQSVMPRLRAARLQPLHSNFIQHVWNDDWPASRGNSRLQMGQSSSSDDLSRPFLINASWFPPATHSSHLLILCLSPRCSSLYAPSGSSRSHAPQIIIGVPWICTAFDSVDEYPLMPPSSCRHCLLTLPRTTSVRLSKISPPRRKQSSDCEGQTRLRGRDPRVLKRVLLATYLLLVTSLCSLIIASRRKNGVCLLLAVYRPFVWAGGNAARNSGGKVRASSTVNRAAENKTITCQRATRWLLSLPGRS